MKEAVWGKCHVPRDVQARYLNIFSRQISVNSLRMDHRVTVIVLIITMKYAAYLICTSQQGVVMFLYGIFIVWLLLKPVYSLEF